MTHDCDVVVLGLGPGGEAAATSLARAGLSVVAVDERLVGGECPYYGCIPSKMGIRAARTLAEARRVTDLAGRAEVAPDWAVPATRIRDEATDDWDDTVAVDRLEQAGVRFVRGHGRLAGPGVVEVGEDRFEAARGVVLNTGTAPAVPPVDGLAGTPYWTNRDILRSASLPARLAVLGGGTIGVELAQMAARFGVQVTVVESAPTLLVNEEPEAARLVEEVLAGEGVQLVTGTSASQVEYAEGQFRLTAGDRVIEADRLLVATGRKPNLDGVGLDTVGLDPEARRLSVDDRMRAGEKLWAVGDITGEGQFTHVSMYQSRIATDDILGRDGPRADYRALPRVTFTDPEVGAVGLTEAQAREQGVHVRVGHTDLGSSARGWIARARGLVKLVEDAERGVLVGATSVGPAGGEVLSMLTTAVHAEVPVSTLQTMIYAYPTFHRAVEEALTDLGTS